MDLKRFAIFVVVIGVIVFGFGGLKYLGNSSRATYNADSGENPLSSALGSVAAMSYNADREENQDDAKKIMIAGGIILIIGAGLLFSLKKPA